MFIRRSVGISALLIAWAGSATASQTLTCAINERDFEFDLQAALGSPANARLNGVRGRFDWKPGSGRAAVAIDVTPDVLAQEWIVDSELRLRFHQDGEGEKPEVDLIVIAKRAGESAFRGQYRAVVKAKGIDQKRSGRVRCELGY